MKRGCWIGIFGLCIILLGLAIPAVRAARERARRASCLSPLECCFRKALIIYSMDHDGQFPTNMAGLSTGQNCYVTQPKLFICKSNGTKPGSLTNVDEWMDYTYIYWPTGTKTPTNYPWIYERRFHHGNGVYVAPIEGEVFWDEGAKRLLQFAKEHPDLKIPLPENRR